MTRLVSVIIPLILCGSVQAQSLGSQLIVFPVVSPEFSSGFGLRKDPLGRKVVRHHGGVDLAAPQGSHVRAVMAGRVVYAGNYAGYGKLVTVEHSDGRTTLYGHLSEIIVNIGQPVSAGDLLGRVGSTGSSTGDHLHFELRQDGQVADPARLFPGLTARPRG
jgi:murein DD-endopeptidase MepM/ murein hydrolase activator NlpD